MYSEIAAFFKRHAGLLLLLLLQLLFFVLCDFLFPLRLTTH